MPSEKENILKFYQYVKSDKMLYIIYADVESLVNKINWCANNPEKASPTKIRDHIPCGYSMSTTLAFDHIENKHTLYRKKDRMKKFCKSIKEHAKNVISFEKNKMKPLTKEELK